MTDTPLVLHLSDPARPVESLAARAGAELIREACPGAEVRGVTARSGFGWGTHDKAWILGLSMSGEKHERDPVCIDPIPDASIAMQVWRMLPHVEPCPSCPGYGWVEEIPGERYVCPDCDSPPQWLRYLDDAVCGRFELPNSQWVWEALLSYPVEDADDGESALQLLLEWDEWYPNRLVWEGRAILRARNSAMGNIFPIRNDADLDRALKRIDELWQAEKGTPDADELDVLVTLVEAYEREHHALPPGDGSEVVSFLQQELKRLRAERDEQAQIARELRRSVSAIPHLEREVSELRAALDSLLPEDPYDSRNLCHYCDTARARGHADDCSWVWACGLVGVEHG